MHTKVRSPFLSFGIEVSSLRAKWVFLLTAFVFLLTIPTNAQCAMCRAALTNDANMEQAKAVNDGIVFLMAVPYLLVAVVGYFIYKMRKTKTKSV